MAEPVAVQAGAVAAELDGAAACGRPVVFHGPGVHDVLLAPNGIPMRIEDLIADLVERDGRWGLIAFTPARGAEILAERPSDDGTPRLPEAGEEPDSVLRHLAECNARGYAVVIDRVEDVLGAHDGTLSGHPADRVAREIFDGHGLRSAMDTRPPMMGIDRSGAFVDAFAGRSGRCVFARIGLPDHATLTAVTGLLAARADAEPARFADVAGPVERIASAARGLRSDDLLDLSKRCAAKRIVLDSARVLAMKSAELPKRSNGVLRLHDPLYMAPGAVAPIPNIDRFVDELRGSPHWPLGALLVGPPGTGKSLGAQVIARGLGLPLVSLNLVMNSLVGESERRIQAALETAEALAPVVVWIDEVDRMYLGRRSEGQSSDGGTSERVQAALFSFIDPRHAGQILFVGTSNRPDLLDAASRDRFKAALPVLLPTRRERAGIVRALARRSGCPLADDAIADDLAGHPALWAVTARDLHDLIATANRIAGAAGALEARHLEAALGRALRRDEQAGSELMTLHALRLCADAAMLPWEHGARGEDLPPFADDVLDSSGRPDRALIDRRLRALQGRS